MRILGDISKVNEIRKNELKKELEFRKAQVKMYPVSSIKSRIKEIPKLTKSIVMDKTGLHKKAMLVALESNLGNVTEACKEAGVGRSNTLCLD
jgi:transcriptional regulator of acetoin/glycerol metabolism